MRCVLLLALAVGCAEEPDPLAACRLGTARQAATIEDRAILGEPAPYVPDLGLAAREDELAGSMAARRAAAWQVVERVLAPVAIDELAGNFGGVAPTIPAWHTWYARDDFERVFRKLYRDLGPEGRAVRAPIDAQAGFAWNAQGSADVTAIDTADEVQGLGGATRVAYSPGAMWHLLESYDRLHHCRLDPEPPAFDTEPMRAGEPVTERRVVDVEACELRVVGPFQAGAGDVRARGDAELYVRRGAPPTTSTYDCVGHDCIVEGGGPIYVAVLAGDAGTRRVDVEYIAADVALPACLDGAMPRDAVIVKADWRRDLGEPLPVFDTSAASMAARLAGDATWRPDGEAAPAADAIYTAQTPTGARFRMPALHVMSKELDHWMWITLWYSTKPDEDFGADRPGSITGPWRNYKMCVATDFLDGQTPSWCSNPYLEEGAHNAGTNCIGCHQHGGTGLAIEDILAAPPTRARNNFFTDYLWAIQGGRGEDLSSTVQAEVDYWDANDP